MAERKSQFFGIFCIQGHKSFHYQRTCTISGQVRQRLHNDFTALEFDHHQFLSLWTQIGARKQGFRIGTQTNDENGMS